MPEVSDLERTSNRFREALEARNAATVAEITARYQAVMLDAGEALRVLLAKVESARIAGTVTSPAWAYQETRLRSLVASLRRSLDSYAADAHVAVRVGQVRAAVDGARSARMLVAEAARAMGLGGTFTEPPIEPVVRAVANIQTGSPLATLFDAMPSQAAAAFEREIVSGLARGRHPNVIAREVSRVAAGPLHRSITIARTEMIRAYRMATRDEFVKNTDILVGWVWHAHLGQGTCATCWAMHGTEHDVGEILDGHPRCRCAMLPRTKTAAEIGTIGTDDVRPRVAKGTSEFARLSALDQKRILGPAKLRAYRAGEITLSDLVKRTHDPSWGSMRSERSLADARLAARRRTMMSDAVRRIG